MGLRSTFGLSGTKRNNHSEALAYWWEINWNPNSAFANKMFNHYNNLAPLSNYEKFGR